MAAHYLYYTTLRQFTKVDMPSQEETGVGLNHWASEQFKKVKSGDHLWVVTIEKGRLTLVGHMEIGKVTSHAGAVSHLGRDGLWEATHHVLCADDTAELMRRVDIHDMAGLLRFKSKKDRLTLSEDGSVSAYQIQSMRQLTTETLGMLGDHWYAEAGDEDGDDDETAAAISSAAGFQVDPLLRKQIEKAAVDAATRTLKKEGWEVSSVEQARCGYDLHARRPNESLHVEVKGMAGGDAAFIITAGELDRAERDEVFELWIVADALSKKPVIQRLTGTQLLRKFDFRPVQYRAVMKP